jgi:hypothetical protein
LIQQQKPQIASVMGSVSQLMHAGRYYFHTITHATSGYKSQRRDRSGGTRGGVEKWRKHKENRGREKDLKIHRKQKNREREE